jgi:hypothetical protein
MVESMIDQSRISLLKNSKDTSNVTFSQALEDGLTHLNWLDGQGTKKCGQEVALVSHSVSPGKAKELMTTDTFGPLFDGLSLSAGLQRSLESRLQARLDVNGSPEYALTWKQWDMKSGPPICALRASGRRTYGSGFSGWRTPVSRTNGGGWNHNPETTKRKMARGQSIDLSDEVCLYLAGWGTPRVGNNNGYGSSKRATDGMARLEDQIHGIIQQLSNAETESTEGYLNPLFSGWLMGFPFIWFEVVD